MSTSKLLIKGGGDGSEKQNLCNKGDAVTCHYFIPSIFDNSCNKKRHLSESLNVTLK